jgi:hypothetical protein
VVVLEVPDRPGGLAAILDALDGTGINVKYAYGFTVRQENKGVLVFCFDDPDAAIRILQKQVINVVGVAGLPKRSKR